MSNEASGQAWKSPYKGGQKLVLLAIADVVNDVHDNRFWMAVPNLADKAAVSTNTARSALQQFVADGWLEVVTESKGRNPSEYRFIGQPSNDCGVEPTLQSEGGQPSNLEDPTLQSGESSPLTNPREPKGHTNARTPRVPEHFDSAWRHYPRKLNRKGAAKAYMARIREGAHPNELLQATRNYAAARRGEDPAFTMHGATFYGPNERWRDWLDPGPDVVAKPRTKANGAVPEAIMRYAERVG